MKNVFLIVLMLTILSAAVAVGSFETTAYAEEKGRININTAAPEKLAEVPGLSKDLAGEICRYREKNGPFKKPDDLLKVPKMTRDILNKMSVKPGPKGELFVPLKKKAGEQDDEEEPSLKPSKC